VDVDPPDVDAFADPDVTQNGSAEPSPLRRLVLAQFHEPGGAAIRLLTSATVGTDPFRAGEVAAAARALGLDPDRVELFSDDAYLLQSALGEQTLTSGRDGATEGPVVIACNYHDVSRENRLAVRERLTRLRDLGPVLDLDAIDVESPRIVVGFYDAYRDAGLFGAELCDELGVRALFFPIFEQDDEPGAAGLRDDELADLARRHEIGFHTASHVRAAQVGVADLQHEVHDVLDRIEAITGRAPRIAAWRGGTRWDETNLGDRVLRERGVGHVMSNWAVEAIPLEGSSDGDGRGL
jgi:hypothetical protein